MTEDYEKNIYHFCNRNLLNSDNDVCDLKAFHDAIIETKEGAITKKIHLEFPSKENLQYQEMRDFHRLFDILLLWSITFCFAAILCKI